MLNYLKGHVNKNKYVNILIDIYFEVKKNLMQSVWLFKI